MSASLVAWRGPSAVDGSRIVAILQVGTDNRKTGPIPSLWIEPDYTAHANPEAVCGSCPFRSGGCYVDARGVHSIRRATKGAPASMRRAVALIRGQVLRLGSHGDPLALPLPILRQLSTHASAVVGYTHRWRQCRSQWARLHLMASVESAADAATAQAQGWRTYRARPVGSALQAGEMQCPAVTRPGVTCQLCRACGNLGRRSVSVEVHGGAVAAVVAARLVR